MKRSLSFFAWTTKDLAAQRELEKAVATVLAGGAERPLPLQRERGSPLTVIVTPTIGLNRVR